MPARKNSVNEPAARAGGITRSVSPYASTRLGRPPAMSA